jgi:hypothetical protein
MFGHELLDQRHGPVLRGVVDNHDIVSAADLVQGRQRRFQRGQDPFLFVVAGHEERKIAFRYSIWQACVHGVSREICSRIVGEGDVPRGNLLPTIANRKRSKIRPTMRNCGLPE